MSIFRRNIIFRCDKPMFQYKTLEKTGLMVALWRIFCSILEKVAVAVEKKLYWITLNSRFNLYICKKQKFLFFVQFTID